MHRRSSRCRLILQKIGDVVGQRGKTINAIIEQTGVKIDITDEGAVSICGTDADMMDRAVRTDPHHCDRFRGRTDSFQVKS